MRGWRPLGSGADKYWRRVVLLAPPATLSSLLPPLPPRVQGSVKRASQSALLLGPEHFLRWAAFMSSCDGVSPIVFRAGAVLAEGVTYSPREGSCQPQKLRAPADNWFGKCREVRHEEVSFYLLSRRGRLRDQRLSHHLSSPACLGQTAGTTFQLSP